MSFTRSHDDFGKARELIPGGVNSPVRAFANVEREPIFYDHAQGSHVWDVDGNEYLDFVGSWGPMILGHRPQVVIDAVEEQMRRGFSYGAPCEAEICMADKLAHLVPCIEKSRMVSSGTEATMSAIRLARGYTGREKFIKFEGNYHGHSDALLVSAGSGVATFGIPDTPGVTKGAANDTLVCRYNDVENVRETFDANQGDIAAVIVEPVAGNMGCVLPAPGFLQGLRDLCDEQGAVLIFDEVISGFRMSLGGAQEHYGVTPDLVTLGKIIGGGFPVGAFGGKAAIMDSLAPLGPVYQAGTLSGNPIAMQAGLAMLAKLENPGVYERLEALGRRLETGLNDAIKSSGVPACVNRAGSLTTLFFTPGPVLDWDSAAKSDTDRFRQWFAGMTEHGLLLAPSQFECLFISAAHTENEIDRFIEAAREVLDNMAY